MNRLRPRFASVVFDADSTLSAIEGIDWLASLRGPLVTAEISALTERAMNGLVPLEDVYSQRIARIRPTREELRELGAEYVRNIVPGVVELVNQLHEHDVVTCIVSGGIREALLPLASHLGIDESRVFAVVPGSAPQPLSTQTGKITVVDSLIRANLLPSPIALAGDGATDAAVRNIIHSFIAFTGVVRRPAVVALAASEARNMKELSALLFN